MLYDFLSVPLSQERLLATPIQQSDLLAAAAPRAELLRVFGELASTAEYKEIGATAFPSTEALHETEIKLSYALGLALC